jgi:outer membrane immunogenic protein
MSRIFLAAVVSALTIGAAQTVSAQDILRSMYSSTPVASWTGFYVGGNFGYGWASADALARSATTASTSYTMKGATAGGQLGANVQSGIWLVGIESDLQWSWQKEHGGNTAALFASAGGGVPSGIAETDKVTWYGTTRARLGIVGGPVLIYGTGGIAYGQFKFESNFANPLTFKTTTTRIGWAVGGGFETMLSRNWSLKAEYLHLDFGAFDDNYVVVVGGVGTPATLHTRLQNEILRVGVNYFFR